MPTLMWGERGLVATFFLDLSTDITLDRWKKFFSAIQFTQTSQERSLDWSRIKSFWAVVEPSFGTKGFGFPDLVVRAELENETAVLFLEAKIGTFAESTLAPEQRGRKGFNSRLNGQIELNHRLALALQHPNNGPLQENDWVKIAYRGTGRLRRVVNKAVLRQLVEPLRGASCYLHVAVTSDLSSPFNGNLGGFLPQVFLEASGQDSWKQESSRFGWISWEKLKDLAMCWQPSLFRDSYALNKLYFDDDDDKQPPPGQVTVPHFWPSGRPHVGVSVVFAPKFAEQTAVHFSWKGEACRVRNYKLLSKNGDAQVTDANTLEVLPLIANEKKPERPRPNVRDTQAWVAIINEANSGWGL